MPRENQGPHLWQDKKSGIWYIRNFERGDRVLRSTRERDRTRAQAVLARALVALDRPALPPEPNVAAVVNAYADSRKQTIGHSQLASKCRAVIRHMGHLQPIDVNQGHVRAYIAARKREGVSKKKPSGTGPGTIRAELTHLRTALRWAAAEAFISPPRPFSIPLQAKARDRWLTRAECDALVDAAKQPHTRMWLMLMLHTACRPTAALELPWKAVDFDRRVVAYPAKEGGKKRVSVPINDDLLNELLAARERAISEWVVEWAGGAIKRNRAAWVTVRDDSGIAHCTRHDLRRTAGSLMLQAGVKIEIVSEILGHANINITKKVYAHLTVDHLREGVATLSRPRSAPEKVTAADRSNERFEVPSGQQTQASGAR